MIRLLFFPIAVTVAAVILYAAATADAHYRPGQHNVRHALNLAWCGKANRYCGASSEAWQVAGCESGWTFSPWASNGRYLGIFQVSDHWRRTVPGFRFNVWAQARHAHRVYRLTGGWSHWACSPW